MVRSKKILIVDDELPIREVLSASLRDEGHEVRLAGDGESGLQELRVFQPDIVFLDIWMPGTLDGIEVLQKARTLRSQAEFIMISGHGTIETAVKATKLGAWDFIEKPLSMDKILITLANIQNFLSEKEQKMQLLTRLRKSIAIYGESPLMMNLKKHIADCSAIDGAVLITGEAGSGRELVAENIHYMGPRVGHEWVVFQSSRHPQDLLEIELFGTSTRKGKFDLAAGGSLYLEDAHLLPENVLQKFAEKLSAKEMQSRPMQLPRLIGSTASSVEDLSPSLQSLFEVVLHIPSLRHRLSDVPTLVEVFSDEVVREGGVSKKRFTPQALQILQKHSWPGNVKELRNFIERVYILTPSEDVDVYDVQFAGLQSPESGPRASGMKTFRDARADFERQYLVAQLAEHSGNISRTAEAIGLERSYLHRKLKSYGIESQRPEGDSDLVASVGQDLTVDQHKRSVE